MCFQMYWVKNYDHLLKNAADVSFKCNWSISQFIVVIISFICALGVGQDVFKQESQLCAVKDVLCLKAWLCIVTKKEVWDSTVLWLYILLYSTHFLVHCVWFTIYIPSYIPDCGHKYVLKWCKPGVVPTDMKT
jgi:hypothetical protein